MSGVRCFLIGSSSTTLILTGKVTQMMDVILLFAGFMLAGSYITDFI